MPIWGREQQPNFERNQMSVAWDKLAEDKENPQPTPPVGEPVVWYMEGDVRKPVAAQCNGVEGPGRIKITIAAWNGFPMHRTGCHHITHSIHQKPNQTTKNCGAWDYPRGKAPKADFELHDQEIQRRTDALIKAEEDAIKNQKLFEQKKAEREAGIKRKPLPEPLPSQSS